MIESPARATEAGAMDALAALWRWKFTIVVPVFAGMGLAYAAYQATPTHYTSETVLVMEARRQQVLPEKPLLEPLSPEHRVIETELDVISSHETAAAVARILEEEGVALRTSLPTRNPIVAMVTRLFGSIGTAIAEARAGPDASSGRSRQSHPAADVEDLLSGLRVSNDGISYTIFINYVSSDSEYSAAAANAFARAYLGQQVAIYEDAAKRAADWLKPRVADLRNELEAAGRRLQRHRIAAGLAMDGGQTMSEQRLTALNTELVKARAEIAEAKARLDSATTGATVAGFAVESPLLASLLEERAQIGRDQARLVGQGALKSRKLAEIELDLASIDQQIGKELDRVADRLANEVAVAERKAAIISHEIEAMRTALAANHEALIEAAQLEREVEATSAIYESFLMRYKEAIRQQGFATADARVISRARPGVPEGNGRMAKWLMAGIVLGGFVGVGGAVTRGASAARLASPSAIDAETRASVLGFVPPLGGRTLRRAERMPLDTRSAWGRAMRQVHANLGLFLDDDAPSVLAVTSAADRDDKISVAIGIAQACAASGGRVLLVDGNAHHPRIAERLGLPTISGAAADQAPETLLAPDRLQSTSWGGDLLTLRASDALPAATFGARRLKALAALARERYDLTILDAPAMPENPDAIQFAASADHAVLVVRWRSSRKADVKWALEQLGAVLRGRSVGVVFTRLGHGACQLRPPRDSNPGTRSV